MNIGRPVKTDTTTSLVSIGKFARVCVELDLSRPLLSKFTLEGEIVPIEYEGIQMVCFKCGMYGHKKDQCGSQNLNEEGKGAEAQTDQEQNDITQTKGKEQPKYQYTKPVRDFSKNFGEWMLVAKKERKGYRRDGARAPNTGNRNHVQPQAAGAGGPQFQSRYAALEDLDNNGNELQLEDRTTTPMIQNVQQSLPNIRTNQDQYRQRRQSENLHQTEMQTYTKGRAVGGVQLNTGGRGNARNRGGRRAQPRRAAAESEHTVDAASNEFRRTLKKFCRDHTPDVVCLIEPKVLGSHANSICKKLGFDEWVRVEAVGFSGGIWILWKASLKIEIINTHPQFINLQVQEGLLSQWTFTVVYGSPNKSLRRRLFADLSSDNMRTQQCWLICGDFNAVTSREEVSNPGCFNNTRSVDFVEWIFREGLVDLGFEGPKFTWRRGENTSHYKAARLDRAFGNEDWKLSFPNTKIEHLPIINSDHAPLLITTNPIVTFDGNRKF
ncbi:uncharacterized protein LOC115996077 [Ipomoea triloba]|uniref:uncharacterized protein LOC115996077 n=1 Tax=Ipomoea triloba TaxID=35885 RepID=UPI00125E2E62|nr:uncharacterized protein LOC115996077 [Ipomoea triloba]